MHNKNTCDHDVQQKLSQITEQYMFRQSFDYYKRWPCPDEFGKWSHEFYLTYGPIHMGPKAYSCQQVPT